MLRRVLNLTVVLTVGVAGFYCLPVERVCTRMMSIVTPHSCENTTSCPCIVERPSSDPAVVEYPSVEIKPIVSLFQDSLIKTTEITSVQTLFQSLKSPPPLPLYQSFSTYRI